MSIVPKLKGRWWSLILKHTLWNNLPPEIALMIHEYITIEDPIFIKQKHIPCIISKPGRYIMVENINFYPDIANPASKNKAAINIISSNVTLYGNNNILKSSATGIKIGSRKGVHLLGIGIYNMQIHNADIGVMVV